MKRCFHLKREVVKLSEGKGEHRVTLGKRLAELRKQKGKPQSAVAKELSHLASANISRSALSLWELDIHEPDAEMLRLLATYFGVTVDYLLGRPVEATVGEAAAPYTLEDLAARWPNLSSDRRRRAAQMERDAREVGIDEMHLDSDLTNEQFDDLIRGMTAFAALMARQAKPKATE